MPMSFQEVADELVAGCRENRTTENLDKLYAADAVSVEAGLAPGMESRETKGLDGIKGKHAWWEASFEPHDFSVQGPYPHGDDRFAVIFEMDVTEKATGTRSQMKEVGIYHVADGKITREEFYYPMG